MTTKAHLEIKEIILNALAEGVIDKTFPAEPIPGFNIEIPADKSFGDFSSNVAMICAKTFKMPPVKIAQYICDKAILDGTYFVKCEAKSPGFLNFFLAPRWFSDVIKEVLNKNEHYGKSDYGNNRKVQIEFVSANPTGPMHMGNARGGALGDCLASVMEAAGYQVTREFYVNDAGNQIDKFALSLDVRFLQAVNGEDFAKLPEDAYQGEDIKNRIAEYIAECGTEIISLPEDQRRKILVDYALPKNIQSLKDDLHKYRIDYDVWFYESTLHKSNRVSQIIEILENKGLVYRKDDAVWYKATGFGAEKDEVLVRANGNPTYFAADIAYHYDKFAERKFDKVINIWGADHHGHVARLKGAMEALGIDSYKLDIVLMQLVRLTQNGEVVRMSKRTGKAITLTDLIDEIPIDAARFFFNLREPNSHFDFDLSLAVEQTSQNPVYYVQYAHARICSIIRNMDSKGIHAQDQPYETLALLESTEERELIRKIATLPDEIIESAKNYDPAKMTHYLTELSALFHKFYNAHKVDCDDQSLAKARLALCFCVKTVLHSVLNMLKITAPESM